MGMNIPDPPPPPPLWLRLKYHDPSPILPSTVTKMIVQILLSHLTIDGLIKI